MIDKPISLGVTIAIAIGVFIATAIVDALINVWIFKRMGGCPLDAEKGKKKGVIPAMRVTGRPLAPAEPVIAP